MDTVVSALLASVALFALAMVGLAVGVIFAGRRLRGSCGGTGACGPAGEPVRCAACPNRRAP